MTTREKAERIFEFQRDVRRYLDALMEYDVPGYKKIAEENQDVAAYFRRLGAFPYASRLMVDMIEWIIEGKGDLASGSENQ